MLKQYLSSTNVNLTSVAVDKAIDQFSKTELSKAELSKSEVKEDLSTTGDVVQTNLPQKPALTLKMPSKKYSVVNTMSCDGYYAIGVTDKSLDQYMRELEMVKARVTWTTLHTPESGTLVASFDTLKEAKENEYFITLEFMCLYGIHKVRGSKFSNCVLSFEEIEQINSELSYFYNKCSICDEHGHDSKNCTGKEFN
jgi:hypothetical protein